MKKIIILLVLIFNLIPVLKKGEIKFLNANELMAQGMGEEEFDWRNPNGHHTVLWEDGHYTYYWDPVPTGNEGNNTPENNGYEYRDDPPDEIDYDDEHGPYYDLLDPEDGYWHIFNYWGDEYLYEWDPLDRQFQLVINVNTGPPNPKPKYYITLNTETHRYYDGDKIYVQKQNTPITLTIHNSNGAAWSSGDFVWKRKGVIDTTKCTALINCDFIVDVLGVTQVRVDSAGVKTLIKNPLIVGDKPTSIFQRDFFSGGCYGFDDTTHKYLDLRTNLDYKKGLEVRTINTDTSYVVPWMSILPQNQYNIRIKKVNLDPGLANDPNFWVAFVPEIFNISLDVNYPTVKHFNYTELLALDNLVVSAQEWTQNINELKKYNNYDSLIRSVYAITNSGDTIGKLNITCSHAEVKKVAIVYVNSGSGYNSNFDLQKQNILTYLNNNSHSQMMRKWVLDNTYSDTLNMQSEYAANPQWLSIGSDTLYPNLFTQYYKLHKNINIDSISQQNFPDFPDRLYVMFVTTFPMSKADTVGTVITTTSTNGITNMDGPSAALFSTANRITVAHEMGHILKLHHTFEDNPIDVTSRYHLVKYSTTNFMDYTAPGNFDAKDMFYYTQWIDVR